MEQKNELDKKTTYPAQATVVLRLAAGGYLLYLSYGLVRDILASTVEGGIIHGVFVVLFAIIGAILFGWSAWKLYKGEYLRPGQLPEEDSSEEENES